MIRGTQVSIRVAFVSVVPSPYQRDLFRALAERPEVDLRVYYLERESPDSPWPSEPLASWESILRGTWLQLGGARVHLNLPPDLRRFDIVVMNTLMSLTAQWIMRARLRTLPWIFWGERLTGCGHLHDMLSAPVHRADGIAAIGTVAQGAYRRRFPEPRNFCIPYHCDLAPFLTAPRPPPREFVTFLFCGQMIARKGIDLLLAAFEPLEHARLLLVGREADLPSLFARLRSETLSRIEFVGFQSPRDLASFFSKADVFVLPSRHDGWGVVVNQALGAGLPILCSEAVGAAHDLVEPEVNGLTFPAGDIAALAAAMRRCIDNRARLADWGDASRRKADSWTPEAGAAKWVEAIETVLAR